MDVTIVALPAVDDRVYKISSEQVPHLTLAYLGDLSSGDKLQTVVEFVQHAASQLSPFGMQVDYRGTLGPKDADVLFFNKHGYDIERIADFRHFLLMNDTIQAAYNSVEQYPEWTPHLTLGFPDAPAREDDAEYPRFHYVDFDRIAVWTDNYDGPEFRLSYDESRFMAVDSAAWSSMTTTEKGAAAAAELFHYGKKGMKWGVRNDKGHEGEQVKTKQLAKLDKKWEKENTGVKGWVKAQNAMADRLNNGEIDKFNSDPRWADVNLNKDTDLERTYMSEYSNLCDKIFVEETLKLGSNPSGSRKFELIEQDGETYVQLSPEKSVKHADTEETPVFRLVRDANGHITSMEETTLKHYGVKGMRWGVTTKDRAAERTAAPVTVTQKKPGKFAKAAGGENHPLHPDAETALAARQKAKSSTTDALSNTELRTAIDRMQLETRYNQLNFQSDRRSRGARFIAGLLGQKRYGGKDLKYLDTNEEQGAQTRDAIKKAMAARAAAAAMAAV